MDDDKKYLLDKTLSRLDTYITSVNTKAAFIVTFNVFVLGAVIVNCNGVMAPIKIAIYKYLIGLLFYVIAAGAALSVFYVFKAVSPFLKSGNADESYQTLLFFGSISNMGLDKYRESVLQSDADMIITDLIRQNHILAVGASEKFKNLSTSIFLLIYFVIVPISLILMIILSDVLWHVSQ